MTALHGHGDYASPDELDDHSEPAYRCGAPRCDWSGDSPTEDIEEQTSELVAARTVLLCPRCGAVARPNVDSDGYSDRMRAEIREVNEQIAEVEKCLTMLIAQRDALVSGLRETETERVRCRDVLIRALRA